MAKSKRTRYTTGKRVDMRKGGRVAMQRGKMPPSIKVGEPVRDKAIEVGEPVKRNPNLSPTRRGAAPTPPEGKLKQVGNPLPELSQAEKDRRQKLAQDRIDANKKLMEQNPLKPVIQNLDNQRIDSPKSIQPVPKNKVPPKQPPMSVGGVGGGQMMTGREELKLVNQSLRSDTVQPRMRMTNDLPKFIPGQPTASRSAVPGATKGEAELIKETGGLRQVQALQTAQQFRPTPTPAPAEGTQRQPIEAPQPRANQDRVTAQPFRPTVGETAPITPPTQAQINTQQTIAGEPEPGYGRPPYDDFYRPPTTPPGYTPPGYTPPTGTPTDEQLKAQFEKERGERVIETGQLAERVAAGDIPEGMVPQIEVEKLMERRPDETEDQYQARMATLESDIVKLQPTAQAVAKTVGQTPAERVQQMAAQVGKTPEQINTAKVVASQISDSPEIQAAVGSLSDEAIAKVDEIRKLSGPAEAAKIVQSVANAAKATTVDAVISAGAFVPEVDGIAAQVSETPQAEAQTREALTGVPATDGQAAQIIGMVGYESAKQRAVKGTAAKGAAAEMVAETGSLPPEISAAIVEDPATVEAQVDTEPVEVQAAIAALPTEALVSSQIENLLGGMENGEIPLWARPAVDAVNQNMAQRGLTASTVGRDALFNAIIQTALPMAQSNASALQQRAAQNLSNQQQANLQQATQQQQLRMQNLANRQEAASQTAQMAQQMSVLQSQFEQQAVMTTAEQQQQTRMQNLANQQQAAVLNAQNQQAMNAQNLGNDQQINLANLQIEAQVEGANQAAENQERLAEMQVAADFLSKNAAFKQQMELANLSNDQQMRLANLSALNQASSENLSAAQQTELANLNTQMNMNIKNAELAQQMGLAQLNVDQQRAMQNANMVANMDMAKFNNAQQVELANSKFMQTVTLENFNAEQQSIMQNATAMAQLDLATVDQRTKLAVSNAQSFLQMDMANLNNQQQSNILRAQQEQQRLLSNQSAENAARQFNATSENQTNQFMASLAAQMQQFNVAQMNAASQFNAQQQNAAFARQADRVQDVNKANAAILNQVNQFNAQMDFSRQQWNAANEQAVINSNVNWRRQANLADTAAQNAVNQQNAQNAFSLSSSALSFLWQELRDQADYDFRWATDSANRKLNAMIAAASSEGDAAKNWSTNFKNAASTIDRIFGQGD